MDIRNRSGARTRSYFVVCCLILLGACEGPFLPESGPGRLAFQNQAAIVQPADPQSGERYALIALSPVVIEQLQQPEPAGNLSKLPQKPGNANVNIGVGDLVGISIFESAAGGLFMPDSAGGRQGNFVQLPVQQVPSNGTIAVPYAGAISVAGRTPAAVQAEIERRLKGRALDPQALVSIVEHRSSVVSVLGDVLQSVRYSLDPGGDRILGAIARAQGPKFADFETMVTLQRDGRSSRALLSEIGQDPSENVQIRGGDTVFISRVQRYFLALGALGVSNSSQVNRRIPFEDVSLSLADAIAKAGGLAGDRANPRGVFLYRREPTARVLPVLQAATKEPLPLVVPTIYMLDNSRPDGMFLATRFAMQPEDVIYVSDAPSTDLAKFLALVLPTATSTSYLRTGVAPRY